MSVVCENVHPVQRVRELESENARLRSALSEMLDAAEAMLWVIALGDLVETLETELQASGVRGGFAFRASAALAGEEAHR